MCGVSASDLGYNLRDSWWGVPFISKLPIIPVQLGQLREIGVPTKSSLDSFSVEDIGIRGQLNPVIGNAAAKIAHECLRVLAGTFSYNERRNQFCVGIEGHEHPLIAEFSGVILLDVLCLFHQESPYFIALNSFAGQLPHTFIQQLCASFPTG
jgi:hypothetical protein